jgi:hypothetical protein
MDPARGSQIVDRSDDFGHYPVQELFLLGKNYTLAQKILVLGRRV